MVHVLHVVNQYPMVPKIGKTEFSQLFQRQKGITINNAYICINPSIKK
jgi:hypothetical protein